MKRTIKIKHFLRLILKLNAYFMMLNIRTIMPRRASKCNAEGGRLHVIDNSAVILGADVEL
jgi:hypothetical protein